MKNLLSLLFLLFLAVEVNAQIVYAPTSNVSTTGGATYCQNVSASNLTYNYNTCNSGSGITTGVSITISWYSNTVNSTSGGSLVSSTSGTCSTSATGSVTYQPSTAATGTLFYYCTLTWVGAGTCKVAGTLTSATATVIVNTAPGPITGNAFSCVGAVSTLSNSVVGGTWSSSASSRATVSPTGVVTGLLTTTPLANINYAIGSCVASVPFTVNTTPAAITGTQTVCEAALVTFSNTIGGGTWTSASTSTASVNSLTGVITGVLAGSTNITYTIGSCLATRALTVKTSPAAISGANSLCNAASITLTDATGSGTWTTSGSPPATVNGSGVVTGTGTGTANITYTAAGCFAIKALTVLGSPASITGAQTICEGATVTIASSTNFGTWSSNNTAIATIATFNSSNGIVTGVSAGSTTLTYSTGCGANQTRTFTVNASPAAITGGSSVCEGFSVTLANSVGGGTWSRVNGTGTATISAGGVVTGQTAGTVTISYTLGTCAAVLAFTVNTQPAAITGIQAVCSGFVTTFDDATVGGTWSVNNPAIATIDASTPVNITGLGAGTTTITYTSAAGTCTVTRAVTVDNTPAGTITGTLSACEGSVVTLSNATGGGAWTSGTTSVATIGSSSGAVSAVLGGTTTISYTTSTCRTTAIFTVNANPAAITGTQNVCERLTTVFTDATGGGTWSTSNGSVATIDASSPVNVTGVLAGSATISYTLPAGCFVTRSVSVTTAPAVITGTLSGCGAFTTTLSDATGGGTWSSSNTGVATIDASSGYLSAVSPGTTSIQYTIGSCFAVKEFTVFTAPASIGAVTQTVCEGSTITYTNATANGTWSSDNTGIASVNATTGVITGVAAGNTIISYATACGASSSKTVTVNTSPAAITGGTAVCQGSSVTLTNSVGGGTWSVTNGTGNATINAGGLITGISAGSVTVSYTIGSCTSTLAFTVNALPASITGTQTVCSGFSTTFADATGGGTWSINDPSVATIDGASPVNITGINTGSTTVTYTTAVGSCIATRTITVDNSPAGTITGTLSACAGTITTLSNATGGGTWTSGTTSVATVGSGTGAVTAVSAGTSTISYTLSSCRATAIFTVNANPASISGTQTTCPGTSTTFSDATASGTWSTSNSGIATIDASSPVTITGVVAGNAIISYTLSTGCFATRAITVNSAPAAITGSLSACPLTTVTLSDVTGTGTWSRVNQTGTLNINSSTGAATALTAGTSLISYTVGSCAATAVFTINANPTAISSTTQVVCEGSVITFSDATAGGAWSVNNGSIATIDASSPVNITGVAAGNTTITYTSSLGCTVVKAVTVNATPPAITGTASACIGSSTTLFNATGGGTWSSTASSRATVSASGVVTAVLSTTPYAVINYTVNGCKSSITYTVNPTPGAIGGTRNICEDFVTTLTNSISGGTWTIDDPSVATVNSSTGAYTGASAGTSPITYTASGCFAASTLTVLASPAAITGTLSACPGSTVTLSNASPGGTWSSLSTLKATIGTSGDVHAIAVGTSTISYTTGTCAATANFSVLGTPAAIGATTQNVCEGSNITYTNSTIFGTWSSNNTSVATVTSSTGIVSGVAAGNTTITYSTGCGANAVKAVTVAVQPAGITGTGSVCEGATVTLADATGGGTWSRTDGSGSATVSSSSGAVTGISSGNSTISYTLGSCFSTSVVTVNVQPAAIGGANLVCLGSPITLTDAIAGGTWSSSNTGFATVDASTGEVFAVSPGSLNINYTLGSCQSTKAVTANAAPAAPASITGTTTFCTGIMSTLADVTGGGVWSSASTGVATITAGGVVTGVSAGSSVISYAFTNSCATVAATTNVTVVGYPTASITSAPDICTGYSTTVVFTGTSGAEITYQVDGGASSLATLTGGTFSLGTGTVTSTHNYTLVDVHNATCTTNVAQTEDVNPIIMTWVGGNFGHETEWNRAANWSCGFVPGSSDDVVIPSGTTYNATVETSGSGTTRSLTIASGATVSLSTSAMLNVKGTLTNNGTVGGPGILSMNNTSAQTVGGIGVVNNFDLNNSSGATVSTGSRLTINSVLSVTSGTLATGDSVVLNSTDTTVAARIAQLPFSGSTITGNVKVNQYIKGGYRRYRFWSHPFNAAISLGQAENFIDITGVGGSTNGFTTTASNAASAFRYDPTRGNASLSNDPGWKEFTNIGPSAADTNKLNRYQGIRLFMRGAKGEGLGFDTYIPSATVISQWGVPNQGDQVVTLKKGASANQQYNMVGNPYASPVDVGTVLSNAKAAGQITGGLYVWNVAIGTSGNYQTISVNSVTPVPYYLQANECFQVQAVFNGATLTFSESNKGSNRTINLLKAPKEGISLYVYDANYHIYDMLEMNFTESATSAEDNDDARKLLTEDFGFYSLSSDNQKLAIDLRPYAAEQVIPLGLKSIYTQEYIIKAENLNVSAGTVYLHDKLLNQYVLLSQGTEYRFTVDKNEKTQGDNRFELSMKPAEQTATTVKGLQVSMTPNPATDEVKISFTSGKKEAMTVRVMDMSGVSIYSEDLGTQQNGSVNVPLSNFAPGIYMVELTSGKDKTVHRLVKE